MKTVVFIENHAHFDVLDKIPSLRDTKPLVVSCDETLVKRLREKGYDAEWLESYLDPGDEKKVESQSWQGALEWHGAASRRPFFEYRSIHLPDLTIFPFNCALYWIYKNWIAVKRFFQKVDCDRIICFRDPRQTPGDLKPNTGELIYGDILLAMNKKVEWVEAPAPIRDAMSESRLKASVKKLARFVLSLLYEATRGRALEKAQKRKHPGSPHVLFCSALPYVKDVIEKLKPSSCVSYLGEDFRLAKLPYLNEAGIPHFTYEFRRRVWELFPTQESKAFFRRWSEAKAAVYRGLEKETVFSFEGDNLFQAVRKRLEWLTEREFRNLVSSIDIFSEFLRQKAVRMVVVDEDSISFRRTLVTVAKRAGIESAVICHVSSPSIRGHEVSPLAAGAILVGGPFMKENFSAVGIPDARIRLTGVPRYDAIPRLDPDRCRSEVFQKLGLRPEQALVTLASSCTRHPRNRGRSWKDIDRGIRDALTYFASHPDTALVIKIHPRDHYDEELTREIVRQVRPKNTFVIRDFNTLALMAASRIVLTYFSSCITEACGLGKPTVVLNYFEEGVLLPPETGSSLCVVKDRNGLFAALGGFDRGEPAALEEFARFREAIVKGLLGFADGRSAARISDAILELAGSRV